MWVSCGLGTHRVGAQPGVTQLNSKHTGKQQANYRMHCTACLQGYGARQAQSDKLKRTAGKGKRVARALEGTLGV